MFPLEEEIFIGRPIFNFKLTQTQIELHSLRTDCNIILQESHFNCHAGRGIELISLQSLHIILQTPLPSELRISQPLMVMPSKRPIRDANSGR